MNLNLKSKFWLHVMHPIAIVRALLVSIKFDSKQFKNNFFNLPGVRWAPINLNQSLANDPMI